MTKGLSIAGRKRDDGIDYYKTPNWAVDKILEVADLEGVILEPCCGDGAFSKKIPGCLASDIRTDEDVAGIKGKDIFTWGENCCDVVITNPPFKYAEEIVRHSLKMSRKRVYMLLKLCFLESESRKDFFATTPLKKVYVFRKRVNMYPANIPENERPKNSGTIAYALYEWEHGYAGEPTIGWL